MNLEQLVIGETERMKKHERIVVINDLHVPYEDKAVVKAVYSFIKDTKPDKVVIAGDFMDFYEISKFSKDPKRESNLQKELDAGKKYLAQLRKIAPKSDIVYVTGNHEDRLRKWLWENPEIASLENMKFENLLGLKDLGIRYISKRSMAYRGVIYSHLDKCNKHAGFAAKGLVEDYGMNIIHGHTHRSGMHCRTQLGTDKVGIENGCLCDNGLDYIEHPNWQHSFTVVEHYGPRTFMELIVLKDKQFTYNGKLYK